MPKGHPKNGLCRGEELLDYWVSRMSAEVRLCACGCGERIVVKKHHRRFGIPQFVTGHHFRNENNKLEKHPNWKPVRSSVSGGRKGCYFTPTIRREIIARDGGKCRQCGSEDRLSCDHVVPVRLGGSACVENGQLLCHSCHVAKTRLEKRSATGASNHDGHR